MEILRGGVTPSAQNNSEGVTEASDVSKETPDGQVASWNPDYNVTWEDMAEITFVYPWMSAIPTGLAEVEAAINEITEKEINVHVHLEMLESGNYDQQVNLMITSGEVVDLMVTMAGGSTSFTTMVSQNQLMDVTELLNEYAPKAVEALGELMEATAVDGKIMAFPAYRNYAAGPYIEMRTDVLEDLGLLEKAQNMTSFSEYEEILEAVKNSDKWGNLVGIVPMSSGAVLPNSQAYAYADQFSDITFIDNLGNTQYCVGVKNGDEDGVVFNAYASEAYKNNWELVRGWYEKGYIYEDAATTTDTGNELIKSGVAFSMINNMGVGAQAAASLVCGRDMTCVLVASKPVDTTACASFTYGVPVTAKEPEAAITFMEMMFNDQRVANLLAWGIEDSDYMIDDAGVAHYIDGNEQPAYHGVSWTMVNEFKVSPWEGETLENWLGQEEYLKSAPISEFLGFSMDTENLNNEISAISTVIREFGGQIGSGIADEAAFNQFLEKLDASGIDKVVSAYQEQLNRWLEENNR